MDTSEEKIAVITGGARGIGAAIAERFATDGIVPVIWDVDIEAGRSRATTLRDGGNESHAVHVDVSDPDSVETATDETVSLLGSIDILVNNAGIPGVSAPLWEQGVSDWKSVIDVNLNGTFYCCRSVVPVMRGNGWGRIVTIASIAGKEGNPLASAYSTSKAGVIGMTKSLAKELVDDDILVNVITPAVVDTEINQDISEEHLTYMLEKIPMGRIGQPEEVAALVAWLSSEECSYSTGAVFDISGGRATY